MPCWFQCQWMSAVILKWAAAVAVSDYGVVLISSLEIIFCILSYLHLGWNDWSVFWFIHKFLIDLWEWGRLHHPQRSYNTKHRQIKPAKRQVRKDIDQSFKAWIQSYEILWSCNRNSMLMNQCRRPLTLKLAWHVIDPANWIGYLLIPLPTATKQKHTLHFH